MKAENHDFFKEYTNAALVIGNENENVNIYPYIKRTFDIVISLIGIIIASPVILLVAVLIKIETPGPSFFLQERVGMYGKYFNVIKLRSMSIDAEKNGARWAEKNDPRITRVGRVIRKTRIDELPQLWNVLIGDMSLVGPRPERPVFTAQFNEEIPGFVERLVVKPGITGWAQINGGYDITPMEKLMLDQYYINNMSFRLDITIAFKTLWVCLSGSGAR